jgi:hypothetical protein
MIGKLNNEYTYSLLGDIKAASKAYIIDEDLMLRSVAWTNCVPKSTVDNYWAPYSLSGIEGCALWNKDNTSLNDLPSIIGLNAPIEVRYKDKQQPSIMTIDFHNLTLNNISCAWVDLGLNTPGGLTLSKINEVNSSQSNFDTILGPHLNYCGAFKTTEFSIDVPIVTNCVPEVFLADISKNIDASSDIIISAKQDILLRILPNAGWWSQLWGSDKNFFKINDTDVSVDDGWGVGGRMIPAGHLITIPRAKVGDIKFKTGDQYCRTDPISLSFKVDQVSLNSPIGCFGGCR